MMPADVDDHGCDYRNLNDTVYRFHFRRFRAEAPFLRRYTDHDARRIYTRNDPLLDHGSANPEFATVLAHELWHALSLDAGIAYAVGHARDEALARDFAESMGLGR